jgi:hypothetical protein
MQESGNTCAVCDLQVSATVIEVFEDGRKPENRCTIERPVGSAVVWPFVVVETREKNEGPFVSQRASCK